MRTFILSFSLSIIMSTSITAQEFVKFSHTVSTHASPKSIWNIWTDVANWDEWDTGLKSASLKGAFKQGAKGKLIPDEGPKSKFKITELKEGKSYTFRTRIPFGALIIRRSLIIQNGMTHFTHEVEFTGWFKKTFAKRFGKRYKEMLPSVMENIKQIAEKEMP